MARRDRDSGTAVHGARRRALQLTGLSAAPDSGMDRSARLASRLLHAPAAFVALAEDGRQILPGMFGLSRPWAERRALPGSRTPFRTVVSSGRPLVVSDRRTDERLGNGPAVADLGMVAFAGMPLTDSDGLVLGALCVIDHAPRTWTPDELADLEDLAAACSAELRLRILSAQRRSAQKAVEAARAAAERARGVAERLEREAQTGLDLAWNVRPRPVWTTPSCS